MQLLIEVADSGVGISPEEQAIIFERFAIARKRQGALAGGGRAHADGGRRARTAMRAARSASACRSASSSSG